MDLARLLACMAKAMLLLWLTKIRNPLTSWNVSPNFAKCVELLTLMLCLDFVAVELEDEYLLQYTQRLIHKFLPAHSKFISEFLWHHSTAFIRIVAKSDAASSMTYLQWIGSLIYPATMTRPDISNHKPVLFGLMHSPTVLAVDNKAVIEISHDLGDITPCISFSIYQIIRSYIRYKLTRNSNSEMGWLSVEIASPMKMREKYLINMILRKFNTKITSKITSEES